MRQVLRGSADDRIVSRRGEPCCASGSAPLFHGPVERAAEFLPRRPVAAGDAANTAQQLAASVRTLRGQHHDGRPDQRARGKDSESRCHSKLTRFRVGAALRGGYWRLAGRFQRRWVSCTHGAWCSGYGKELAQREAEMRSSDGPDEPVVPLLRQRTGRADPLLFGAIPVRGAG